MVSQPGGLWRGVAAVQIYGANTGVGKTIVSALLARRLERWTKPRPFASLYIKPVSTGPSDEQDERYMRRYGPTTGFKQETLWQWAEAASPHVSAALSGNPIPNDSNVIKCLYKKLQQHASECTRNHKDGLVIVETAGGVLSPGPSGTVQADMYRPLRLPVVLVGDHRLGGISSTISAAESLLIRGYDINAVVCFDDGGNLGNSKYLKTHFQRLKIPVLEIPWIPNLENCSKQEEGRVMDTYYRMTAKTSCVKELANLIFSNHRERLEDMDDMAERTHQAIWHPFTQNRSKEEIDDILVIDSAYGDHFQAKHTPKSSTTPTDEARVLHPVFDGSASWWTQGLGHGNPHLALAAAYAAGRYGHVMFAGATHQPALHLAERLIKYVRNPAVNTRRRSKVFYSDNGSTGVEVGIKMALRAVCKRYGWDGSTEDIGVLGLKGGYHGDTIGAMDASEPCDYNKKVDWYRGRGYWFDFPVVKMREGKWFIDPPAGLTEEFGPTQQFAGLGDIFDLETRGSSAQYECYIRDTLDRLVRTEGKKFGALIMEPVLLGAGGMLFVDPLFQKSLVEVVRSYAFGEEIPAPTDVLENRWTGLPVLFDEVFTGIYRLGRFNAASFLGVDPDISVHAKLLTGGILPLGVTLASEDIYSAFYGDKKSDALLHGHSYTAHAIGCHVANTALDTMRHMQKSGKWDTYRKSWGSLGVFQHLPEDNCQEDNYQEEVSQEAKYQESGEAPWSMWSLPTVTALSHHPRIDSVIALGSVLALTLKDATGAGYSSNAAVELRDALLNDIQDVQGDEVSVHSRVLGNVIYFMASITAETDALKEVEEELLLKLGVDKC